jgi:hypothetical protein
MTGNCGWATRSRTVPDSGRWVRMLTAAFAIARLLVVHDAGCLVTM